MRGDSWLGSKREPVIGPALEKPLLKLHRAKDVKSFWKAVYRVLSASIAYRNVGLLLQQNPKCACNCKMDAIYARRFLCGKGSQAVRRPSATQDARASE